MAAEVPDVPDEAVREGSLEIRLIPVEVESLMALSERVGAQLAELYKGAKSLEVSNATVGVLNKAYYMFHDLYKKKPPASLAFWKELVPLLEKVSKVQFVTVEGNPPRSVLAEGVRSAEEAAQEEKARRRVTTLDVRVFSKSLRTLHLKYMDVKKSFAGVENVVELILTDTTMECSMAAFTTLRSVHFDRSPINPKSLGTLSYSLRAVSVTLYQRNVEAPLWRGPPAEDALEEFTPWEATTHIRITGSRVPLRLDSSWDQLMRLTHLAITHVQLTTLRTLEPVSRCPNLVALDVSHNKIDRLTALTNVGANLVKLAMSYNRLESVSGICQLSKLRELKIDNNDVTEWSDIRDIADGCQHLSGIWVGGNPIARRFTPTTDIVPFTASVFQFRPLAVDGVPTKGAKRQATPEFLSRYLPLFQRYGPPPEEHDGGAGASARGSVMSYGRALTERQSFAISQSNVRASSTTNRDRSQSMQSHGSKNLHRSRSHHHVKAAKVVVDRPPLQAVVPTDPTLIPDTAEDAMFRRLNVQQLQEKYGDKWQEHAAAIAQSAYRDFPGIPRPADVDDEGHAKKSPSPANPGASETKRRRRHHKEKGESTTVPKEEPSAQAARSTNNATERRALSMEGEQRALMAAEQMRQRLRTTTVEKEPEPAVPRQPPPKPPTGTFAALLDRLSGLDWMSQDAAGKRRKVFPSGVGLMLSAVTEENETIWEVGDLNYNLDANPVEVFISDSAEKAEKLRNRFEGRSLFRVIEFVSGHNKYIRLDAKVGPKTPKDADAITSQTAFKAPLLTLVMDVKGEPQTQPVDLPTDVVHIETSTALSATRRSTAATNRNDFDEGPDASGMRLLHRVAKPKLLAAFVLPLGDATRLFVTALTAALKQCHSRLCVSGITNIWPRTVGEEAVDALPERQLPVKLSVTFVKDRCEKFKLPDIARQRLGSQLAVQGDDLFITLQTYVFEQRFVAKDQLKLITYVNIVKEDEQDDGSIAEYEDSALLILTNTHALIADDRNVKAAQGQAAQRVNHASNFPNPYHHALSTLQGVEVEFDLQGVKLCFMDHVSLKLKTRDPGTTLAVVHAVVSSTQGTRAKLAVRPCRIPSLLTAPLVFSAGIFISPLQNTSVKKARDNNLYPLRETKDDMVPARLVITASELVLFADFDMDEPIEKDENKMAYDERAAKKAELARRPLGALRSLRVAGANVFPLVFGFELQGAKKNEVWACCAQHPNSIAAIYDQLRAVCPRLTVTEISQAQHDQLQCVA